MIIAFVSHLKFLLVSSCFCVLTGILFLLLICFLIQKNKNYLYINISNICVDSSLFERKNKTKNIKKKQLKV